MCRAFEGRIAQLEGDYDGELEDPWDDNNFCDSLADTARLLDERLITGLFEASGTPSDVFDGTKSTADDDDGLAQYQLLAGVVEKFITDRDR